MLTRASDADDVLSATLSKMKLSALNTTTLDAGGRWAVEFPAVEVLRLYVVVSGDSWLAVENEESRYHLRPGDCFLLPHAKRFVMAADLSIKKRLPLHRQDITASDGVVGVVSNGGGEFFAVGSTFQLDGHFQDIVFGRLPSVIHVPAHAEQAAVLRWSLDRFAAEVKSRPAGYALMLSHLAPIMLLQTFRGYLASAAHERNWFVALADPRLSRALAAMQSDPARSWSLDDLARTAGLSRAGFALNFKKWIGVTPMEYLTRWRMLIACDLLQDGERRIAEVASAVGYESESAFSVAFTRVVRCRPGQYRRRRAPAPVPAAGSPPPPRPSTSDPPRGRGGAAQPLQDRPTIAARGRARRLLEKTGARLCAPRRTPRGARRDPAVQRLALVDLPASTREGSASRLVAVRHAPAFFRRPRNRFRPASFTRFHPALSTSPSSRYEEGIDLGG